MFSQTENKTFSISDVKFVKRIEIGNLNPNHPMSDEKKAEQINLLNRCLNEYPKGKIIGKDISFAVYQIGEHQITIEVITYHVGFSRRPFWLD